MADDPPPVIRLDGLLATTRIVHEAIYTLHAELISRSHGVARASDLLAEAARIALIDVPQLTSESRRLVRRWREQSVLDPAGALHAIHDLAAALPRVEADIGRRIDRRRKIASDLKSLLDEAY